MMHRSGRQGVGQGDVGVVGMVGRARIISVALLSIGCGQGDISLPTPDGGGAPLQTIVSSTVAGVAEFPGSGVVLSLHDAATGDALGGIAVVELIKGSEAYYLIVDPQGRYATQWENIDNAGASAVAGLLGASRTPKEVALLAVDQVGGIAELLISLPGWLWDYLVNSRQYDSEVVTLGEMPLRIIEHVVAGQLEDLIIHAGLVFALGPAGVAITIADIAAGSADRIASAVNTTLVLRYLQLGYTADDKFELFTPGLVADHVFQKQMFIRPIGPPSGAPAGTGSARVSIVRASGGQPLEGAHVLASGPTIKGAVATNGSVMFTGLVAGDYTFTVTSPGHHPVVLLGTVESGGTVELRVALHEINAVLAIDAVLGTTWFPLRVLKLTAVYLVVRRGFDSPASVEVVGPTGWNNGQSAVYQVPSVKAGTWDARHLGPTRPVVTGWYTVTVKSQGQESSSTSYVNADQVFGVPSDVRLQPIGSGGVRVLWGAVPGAKSYRVALADLTQCDEFVFCETVAFRIVDGTTSEVDFPSIPLAPGTPYFVGVFATSTDFFRSPPGLPAQFNYGYAASSSAVAITANPMNEATLNCQPMLTTDLLGCGMRSEPPAEFAVAGAQ